MTQQTNKNLFNDIKQRFMLMKNGVVSDMLKATGSPHRIIWGLQLPQLKEIANAVEPSEEIAQMLRADVATRESVLLAPLVLPADKATPELMFLWIKEAPTTEAIDIICHSLGRHLSEPFNLIHQLMSCQEPQMHYAAIRMLAPIAHTDTVRARAIAEAERQRNDALTITPVRLLIEDLDFQEEMRAEQ